MKYFILLTTLLGNIYLHAQEIKRIEPPNWWTGMAHPDVQLMIYGDNIRELTPMIKYSGVRVNRVHKAESPNYLFVDLTIHPKAKPGMVKIEFYSGRTMRAAHHWELKARDRGSAQRSGFNSSDVIYLITPDRFANGKATNDEVAGMKEKPDRSAKGGRHGGDIEGIRRHLDYIRDMGFTAIWLNPVLENDMERSSYHGYSTTDYYEVDPRFGSNEEFRRLVQEGNMKGLNHVMDMIPNHCGSGHWWMNDLPFADWINIWQRYTQTNHRKTVAEDPYASEYDTKMFFDGWFVRSMPDLNQRNPFMAVYLIQNAIWWVEYLGLAGIRVDTYSYSDPAFLTEYCRRILQEYPDLNIVGEQWHTDPVTVAYWQRGVKNENGYVSYLPSVMDFPLHSAMSTALNTEGGWEDHWLSVYETLAHDLVYADPLNIMVFADNHDMSRIFTRVNENYDLFRLALAFICTTRGIPQIFYGTEILMSHPGTDEHVIIRSDFPGGWEGDTVNAFTGKGLTAQQKDAQEFVRKLLQWRKISTVIHTGKLMHFEPDDNVYVYFRYNNEKRVMVILNKNTEPYTLVLNPFYEMLRGFTAGTDILSGKEYPLIEGIALEKAGPLILELE